VWLWDTATGQTHHTIVGHSDRIWHVAYSPDGTTLATAGGDGAAKLWNTSGDQRAIIATSLPVGAGQLTFSPDGMVLASLAVEDRIERTISSELWEFSATPGRCVIKVYPLKNTELKYGWSAFSPNGDALATVYKLGDSPGRIEIFDVPSGDLRVSVNVDEPSRTRPILPIYVAWSSDGRTLATLGRDDARIYLWDAACGVRRATLQRRESTMPVWAVAFSPDGATLAAAEADGTLAFWDARTRRERDNFLAHPVSPNGLAFAPDSQTLATAGSLDRTIKIWDVGTQRERATLQGHAGTVHCLAFSPDGKTLASGSFDGTIRLWDTYTWQELITLDAHKKGVLCVVFSADGQALASCNALTLTDTKGEIAIWSAPMLIAPIIGQ
jgi:WD40 repeat protein